MMLIEQAAFTSSRTQQMDGYQLVAQSPGVTATQAKQLSAWGPAHDSLLCPISRLGSINFHRLPEGTYCISRTVPAGNEYSGRSGPRIFTTFLLVNSDVLRTFSNHPFRLFDAAVAAGHIRVLRRTSDAMPTIKMRGKASPAMPLLLEPLQDAALRRAVMRLAENVLTGPVLVHGEKNLRLTMDRLLNILPIECRRELTFSTGLTQSPQRPLHVMAAAADRLEATHDAQQADARLISLAPEALAESTKAGNQLSCRWLTLVDELLEQGNLQELQELLACPQEGLTLSSLSRWSEVAHC